VSTRPSIELEGVSKAYVKLADQAMLLRSILPFHRPHKEELVALNNLSFSVETGETVGILGRNGAGKSTLMRLLAGVTAPSQGTIRMQGRVAPLLSVGVGFHQEMSGRENIYVNGMLLGLTRSEIDERFDEIVAFSEIPEYIDTPVKFYSSGMYMRLGFSVAVHVSPQIFLIDEVLAVGDVAFQLKCWERMREMQNRGTTIVMVSHNMHVIRLLCPRVLLIRNGVLEFDGDSETAISQHHQFLRVDGAQDHEAHRGMPVTILHRTVTRDGLETAAASQEDFLEVNWTVRMEENVESPHAVFRVLSEDGTLAYSMHTVIGTEWRDFAAGDVTEIRVRFQPRFGGGGTFRLLLDIVKNDGLHILGTDFDGPRVYVAGLAATAGLGDLRAEIAIDNQILSDWPDMMFNGNATAASGEA
jgi:ABC-type polysaccharide/polyol phosphate transport system ATPase subunit